MVMQERALDVPLWRFLLHLLLVFIAATPTAEAAGGESTRMPGPVREHHRSLPVRHRSGLLQTGVQDDVQQFLQPAKAFPEQ